MSQLYCFNFLKQVICYSLDVVSLHPSNKKSAQNQLGLMFSLVGLNQGWSQGSASSWENCAAVSCMLNLELIPPVLMAAEGIYETQDQFSKAQFLFLKALFPHWFTQEKPGERNPSLWCKLIDSSAWLPVCILYFMPVRLVVLQELCNK